MRLLRRIPINTRISVHILSLLLKVQTNNTINTFTQNEKSTIISYQPIVSSIFASSRTKKGN